jgi:methyl-accepting chemotaxis protein
MLQDIAQREGDLTRRLDTVRNDKFGEIASWFNRFASNIQIANGAHQTAGTASAFSGLAQNLEGLVGHFKL